MQIKYISLQKIYIDNKGIGLVEALVAIALAIILIVSLLTLTNFNIRNSLIVTENQDAINSASQLLENLRSEKDSNFNDFYTTVTSSDFCISPNKCTFSSTGVITNTVNLDLSPISYFSVVKTPGNVNQIEINIITLWKVGNTTFSSPLSTTFTNWRAN
jgi:type II secretory pathway pseudopilin PulG